MPDPGHPVRTALAGMRDSLPKGWNPPARALARDVR